MRHKHGRFRALVNVSSEPKRVDIRCMPEDQERAEKSFQYFRSNCEALGFEVTIRASGYEKLATGMSESDQTKTMPSA